jgi:hypothetical protein
MRCGNIFNRITILNTHINRKFPCGDRRELLQLELKIEEEKTIRTNAVIKLEEEKNKGKILEMKQQNIVAGRDVNNGTIENQIENQFVFNININNIENLDSHQLLFVEALKAHSKNITQIIQNIYEHQYNSLEEELQNNKCIKVASDNEYFVKTGGITKKVKFSDIRDQVLKNYDYAIDTTVSSFVEPVDATIYKENTMPLDKLKDFEKSLSYVNNIRNNGIIDKLLKRAVIE